MIDKKQLTDKENSKLKLQKLVDTPLNIRYFNKIRKVKKSFLTHCNVQTR